MDLAFRIEWRGKGPFWEAQGFRELVRACRKATPEWKTLDLPCSSFVEYYCSMADSPYDHPAFEWHLSRRPESSSRYGFGFVSRQALETALGLDYPAYRTQFETLLERDHRFSVVARLVPTVAESKTELLFRWDKSEIVEIVQSKAAFERL